MSENMPELCGQTEKDKLMLVNQSLRSGFWCLEFDKDGSVRSVFMSEEFRNMLGYSGEAEFPNAIASWSDRLHPDDQEETLRRFWDCIRDSAGQHPYDAEFRMQHSSGKYLWFRANGRMLHSADGNPVLMAGTFVEITEEKQERINRERKERRIRETLSRAKLGTWYLEYAAHTAPRLYPDESAARLLGVPSDMTPEGCYQKWLERLDAQDVETVMAGVDALARGERIETTCLWNHPAMGAIFVRFGGYRDDAFRGPGYRICGYVQIVHEEVNRERELTVQLQSAMDSYRQADDDKQKDFLTGFYSRENLHELLHNSEGILNRRISSVFMISIDDFKELNDHFGHRRGDDCLHRIGTALTAFGARHSMRFYRSGGAALLGICFDPRENPRVIASELGQLVYDLNIHREDGPLDRITVSIGCCCEGDTPEQMLDRADTAMYQAQSRGKNRFVVYAEQQ